MAVAYFKDELRRIRFQYADSCGKLEALKRFISSDQFLSPREKDFLAFLDLVFNFHISLMAPEFATIEWYSEKLAETTSKYGAAFMLMRYRPDFAVHYRNRFRLDFPIWLEQIMNVTRTEARRRQAHVLECIYQVAGFCPVDRRELV
jgi:hypothetical protein